MKRTAYWLSAIAALAYLVAMFYTGAYPERTNFVALEANGLLREAPERIETVVLNYSNKARTFTRTAHGWLENGRPLPAATSEALDNAVKFMHTSEPVRSMPLAELEKQDPAEFGLAPPKFTISLMAGGASVLEAGFGRTNPVGMLNYVAVVGRKDLYLLSHFVVEEWDKVGASPSP